MGKLKTSSKVLLVLFAVMIVIYIIISLTGMFEDNANVDNNSNDIIGMNSEEINKAQSYVNNNLVDDIGENDHVWGDLNAPVQMVVYEDMSNTYSANFSDIIERVKKEFSDSITIAFRHYALKPFALAIPSSLALECANEQGKFDSMRSLLLSKTKDNELRESDFEKYAEELSLNTESFNTCLDENRYSDKIALQTDRAKNFDVFGTPTVFINKELVVGARPWDDFVDQDGENVEGIRSIVSRNIQ